MKVSMGTPFRALIALAFVLAVTPVGMAQQPIPVIGRHANTQLKNRWFFAFGYERNRQDIETIKSLVDIAAAHGLNGMVLSFDLDAITSWDEAEIALLREIAAHCERKGIELIPIGFSVGYGGGALKYDRSFATAVPVTIALQSKGGRLIPAPSGNLLVNGNLEDHANGRFWGYEFHDRPGEVSFPDTNAVQGETAVRFENFGNFPHGHGRIMQKVKIKPRRMYPK